MGSYAGPEKNLAQDAGIPFEPILTGKLRRYFDLRNLTDLVRIPLGVMQAWWKLGRLQPDLVFSKGGFVAVPVVWAAWLRRIPVIIHESDAIPGLATRLTAPMARKILLGFEDAKCGLEKWAQKIQVVGAPIRGEIFEGNRKQALALTGFSGNRPVLLVMGGSGGAMALNDAVMQEKSKLTEHFDMVHLTGAGKGEQVKEAHYLSFPYLKSELKDIYTITSIAVSRAGANSLAELSALGIPALLFPLGLDSSRGDQWANAHAMQKSGHFRIADPKESILDQLLSLQETARERSQNLKTTPSAQEVALHIAKICQAG
jgi:UDP-N-acetylglucosamine--N-acetylmuramyl-(pentapeptide) pyrophosphoryl-undecaprenol N-acetylglucosamine transferase